MVYGALDRFQRPLPAPSQRIQATSLTQRCRINQTLLVVWHVVQVGSTVPLIIKIDRVENFLPTCFGEISQSIIKPMRYRHAKQSESQMEMTDKGDCQYSETSAISEREAWPSANIVAITQVDEELPQSSVGSTQEGNLPIHSANFSAILH